MKMLIRQAKIHDPRGPHHGQTMDVLIEKGAFAEISKKIQQGNGAKEIDGHHCILSPGWMELHSSFPEPGFEERETIASGLEAAIRGGFTHVCCTPEGNPFSDNRAQLTYRQKQAEGATAQFLPIGAMTRAGEGKELAEMFDMRQGGAVAFSDGKHHPENTMALRLALEYTRDWGAPVMVTAFDHALSHGYMHEGVQSTLLGIKPIPGIAEVIGVQKALTLAEYTGGRLHLCSISTGGALDQLSAAKSKGVRVTADVNLHHLVFSDEHLASFDSNFKVFPPLRDKGLVLALRQAVQSGLIDALAMDHQPHDIEAKACEFDRASFGMAGLETAAAWALRSGLSTERWLDALTRGPEMVLGIQERHIATGETADFTLLDPEAHWTLTPKNKASKAANYPEMEKEIKGRVRASGFGRSIVING